MEDFKIKYNELLARYHKGILYLEKNPDMVAKWGKGLENIMDSLDKLIKENKIQDENILKGFDEEC